MIKNIHLIIAFILDILLLNIISYASLDLCWFNPMLFISTFICLVYTSRTIKLGTSIIFIIENTIITNNIFLSFLITILLYYFIQLVKSKFNIKRGLIIPCLVVTLFVYEIILVSVLQLVGYININFNELIYKLAHSLSMGVGYGLIMCFLLIKKGSKVKK